MWAVVGPLCGVLLFFFRLRIRLRLVGTASPSAAGATGAFGGAFPSMVLESMVVEECDTRG